MMSLQYTGVCAVHKGMFSTPENIKSTLGDIMSALGVFSTLGDIMSRLGDITGGRSPEGMKFPDFSLTFLDYD